MMVEPSAAVEMVPYSLLTGKSRWTGKLQTPDGRSKGVAVKKVRWGSLLAETLTGARSALSATADRTALRIARQQVCRLPNA